MKDFEYSNLNIVDMNAFLREDTKNYKDFKNSLCGKAYIIETQTLEDDRMIISVVSNQIKAEEKNYEAQKDELLKQNENSSVFSKLFGKNKKQLKELEKVHNENMKELKDRLNHHQTLLQTHTLMLQNIIDKLKEKGFNWSEMKRLIEEKMRQGVLLLNSVSNSSSKVMPKVKIPTEADYDISDLMRKLKKKMTDNIDATERAVRERNYYMLDPNDVDFSNFSPQQRAEYEKLLYHYNYNRERLKHRENARMLRLGMYHSDIHHNKFHYCTKGLSDFAFENLFDFIFGNECEDFVKCHERYKVAIDSKDTKKIRDMDEFFEDKAKELLAKSGYSLSEIDSRLPYVERELKDVCDDPECIEHIVNCEKCSAHVISHAAEEYTNDLINDAMENVVEFEQAHELEQRERVLEMSGPEYNPTNKNK